MAIHTFISTIDAKRVIVSVYCWHGNNRKDIIRECTPETQYSSARVCQMKAIRQMFSAFVHQRQWARRVSEDKDPIRDKAMDRLLRLSVQVDSLHMEELCKAIIDAEQDIIIMHPGEKSRHFHWKKDISSLLEYCRKMLWAKHKDHSIKQSA